MGAKGGQLVLSSEVDERIVIITPDGTEIWVTTVAIKPGKVRTGFSAPMDFQIHRESVWRAIQAENAAAAQVRVGAERQRVEATQ
jgi:carbon storage regulator CsrA